MFYRSRVFPRKLLPRTARVYCVSSCNTRLVVGRTKRSYFIHYRFFSGKFNSGLLEQASRWTLSSSVLPLLWNRTGYKSERQESCILHLQLLSKPNHTASHRRCCYCDKFPALLQSSSQYIFFATAVFRIAWSRFIRPVHTIQCSCTLCVGRVSEDFA